MQNSAVTAVPPAPSDQAAAHFADALRFETDCWDVHESLRRATLAETSPDFAAADFILVDARSHALYEAGHVPGAISLPHGKIVASTLARFPAETVFVVYCAGPHCNGAHRAAIRFSGLGRPVKLMIGGITGWLDEGFTLAVGRDPAPRSPN